VNGGGHVLSAWITDHRGNRYKKSLTQSQYHDQSVLLVYIILRVNVHHPRQTLHAEGKPQKTKQYARKRGLWLSRRQRKNGIVGARGGVALWGHRDFRNHACKDNSSRGRKSYKMKARGRGMRGET